MMEANNNLIQFVTTTKNQQKLVVYRGRCYTLKRTNRNDKYWMCTERSRSCCGTLSTNLEATEVIRSKCSWSVPVQTNNHLEGWHNRMTKRARKHHLGFYQFLKLIIHEQGKTETVVQQMDDDYTRERGFVRCSAAYRFPQRWVNAS
ncbi:hypothetical protein T05_5060 [Trichinella murrelli]|uniref:Uncharacterized protein n=1 Tax=Trichinella murrelli TaxID=144512 RepID=A0A0V0UH87_9BILA|nr:hypothetical protein T05_5060 [Trichinella murrelli]